MIRKLISLGLFMAISVGAANVWAGERHIFYMHGSRLEDGIGGKGEKKGYKKIVARFENKGYRVSSEIRGGVDVDEYANKIAAQVKDLLNNDVSAKDIVVSGFSKGAVMSLLVAIRLENPEIKYVALAGCTDLFDVDYDLVKGDILSIYDIGDHKFSSCEGDISNGEGVKFTEVELESGKGHSVFKRQKDKFIKMWMAPMLEWIER